VSDEEKAARKLSGEFREDERKRTIEEASKWVETLSKRVAVDSAPISSGETCLRPVRQPVYRRHDLCTGVDTERGGILCSMNQLIGNRGGATRSSVEAAVMAVEQAAWQPSSLNICYTMTITQPISELVAKWCRIKKTFKRPQAIQWQIVDKETVDEIIFRTTNMRNRLLLELMARGGMRIGEVLSLTPGDIQERSLAIQNPKSGRPVETVYVPQKILVRLTGYVASKEIGDNERIFPISYVAA
jgi:integrase